MGRYDPQRKVGLRDWVTLKIIAVYPCTPDEDDAKTEKAVRDWFYEQSCDAETRLAGSFVDMLTAEEASALPDGWVDEADSGA